MIGVAHAYHDCVHGVLKMKYCHGNFGFSWGQMIIELDNYRKYIHYILVCVGCIGLSLHNIVDYSVTKSKNSYINRWLGMIC
jgi:hypothetical protein